MSNEVHQGKEIVVYVTAPNEDEAAGIARSLVELKLASCVNIIKDIRSIYRWQGTLQDDSEVLMIIKTREELFDPLTVEVKKLHSYDVPEIIALPISLGSKDYIKWIRESTGQ